MLRFLRKKENLKKIMWGLAILIIPAFVLWGSGSAIRSKGLPKYAGEIFGKKVSFRQYDATLRACRNQALLIYGDEFNKIARFLDLDKQTWERLILLYQAKKEKIKVSDEELIGFIKKLPFFQEDGVFSQKRYKTILNYVFRADPRDFEEQIREMLKVGKLKNKVIEKVELSDEEIEKAYKQENEKVKAFYVFVDPQKFKQEIHAGYEELQDYYQNHKMEFLKPEQVNVQYIALYFDQAPAEVEISEEEIQDYYQQHPEEFSGKDGKENIKPLEEVNTQIREKLLQDKIKQVLEDKIWQISESIGEDLESFEQAAKKNQLALKETGFFGPQQAIPEVGLSFEFLNTAFALKVGEISNIIETPKGYFIIRAKEKKESYVPPLDEIKQRVEEAVVHQKSQELAKTQGQKLLGQIKELMQKEELSFLKATEKLSLTVKETEEFTGSSYISGIGQSATFARAAFALGVGEVSELIAIPNGYCILSLQEIIPIEDEKFAQEKEEFTKKLLAKRQEMSFSIWLTKLKQRANLVNNIEKLSADRHRF